MNNNKIEFPTKKTYWITFDNGEFLSYGITEASQITESIHELKTYSTKSNWKSSLKKNGVDAEELKEL